MTAAASGSFQQRTASAAARILGPAVLALAVLSGSPAAGAAAEPGPGDRVRTEVARVLEVLRNKTLTRDEKWEKVAAIIHNTFDFSYMSRSILGNNWQEATKEEKRQFTEFFAQYLENVYRTRIEEYTDQEVAFDKERVRGERAIVNTRILSGGKEIPVSYRMRQSADEWRVYDVVIEGVSMVSNYRATFNAIAQTSGMQGILKDVQRRIDKYKASGLKPEN